MAVWRTDGAAKADNPAGPASSGRGSAGFAGGSGGPVPGQAGGRGWLGDDRTPGRGRRNLGEHPTFTPLLLRGGVGCQTPLVPQFPLPCGEPSAPPLFKAGLALGSRLDAPQDSTAFPCTGAKGQLRKAHFLLIFLFRLSFSLTTFKMRKEPAKKFCRLAGTGCTGIRLSDAGTRLLKDSLFKIHLF